MITRNDRGGFIGGVCQWRSSAMLTAFFSSFQFFLHSSLPIVYNLSPYNPTRVKYFARINDVV